MRKRWLLLTLALVASSISTAHAKSYALDDVDRSPPARGRAPTCPTTELVTYRGTNLPYDAPLTVHPAFAEPLSRFESIAREVGVEVYGRAPRLVHHDGAFACRTTYTWRRWSEHAFGNAVDIEGFSFPAAARAPS